MKADHSISFAAEGREPRQSSHRGFWSDHIKVRQWPGLWLWYTPCRLQWHWVTLPLTTPLWKMLPEEERFLPFHLSTDEAFRESLSRVESAIFLQQFAAGIYQLFGCPDTTTSAPSALYQEPISSFLVSSPHGFTLSCFSMRKAKFTLWEFRLQVHTQ